MIVVLMLCRPVLPGGAVRGHGERVPERVADPRGAGRHRRTRPHRLSRRQDPTAAEEEEEVGTGSVVCGVGAYSGRWSVEGARARPHLKY